MRLRRLDLARYGKFTDASIDFGPATPRRPDLHIVYGPNEAGKSTAFAAFLDLLFGIDETRKPGYAFLHRPAGLRIGAALEVRDGLRDVVRLHRQPLCDQHARPLADGSIADELAGLTRETYRTMFSLDDDTLEAGGRSIIASDGELGQLLFSASAGLAGFSGNLAALRGEAEAFFKTGGRAQRLNELKKKLKDLKQRKEEVDTLASAHGQLASRCARARATYEEALEARSAMRSKLDDLKRRLAALPKMSELAASRQALKSLPEGPEVPAGWDAMVHTLQVADAELQTRLEGIDGELRRLRRDLNEIPADDGSAAHAEALGRLATVRARYKGAEDDLPDRRMRLRDAEAEVNRLHRQLEPPEGMQAAELVLGARTVGRLRNLIESRSGIDASLAAAGTEESKAARRVAELTGAMVLEDATATERRRKVAILVAAIAVAEGGDQKQRARLAERARATHRSALDARLADLQPWSGDAETLAGMVLPPPVDIEGFKTALSSARKAVVEIGERRDKLRSEALRVETEAAAIMSHGGPPDDAAAAAARQARTEAWIAHRAVLDEASAVAFEKAMAADDDIGTGRLAASSEVVRLRELQRTAQTLSVELGAAEEKLQEAGGDFDAIATHWTSLLNQASPLLATLAPVQFEAWIPRRERALETLTALRTAEADLREAAEDEDAARIALATALQSATGQDVAPGRLEDLVHSARGTASAIEAELTGEGLLTEARGVLETRRVTLREASAAADTWTEAWHAAKSGSWLSACEPPADVACVREILVLLDELGPAIDKRDGLADRVAKMETDQATFIAGIHVIADALGVASASRDPLAVADEIDARIRRADANRAARNTKISDVEEADRRRAETWEAIKAHERRKAEMTGHFGVTTLAEVGEAIRLAERRAGLVVRCEELERLVIEDLRVGSFAAAVDALASSERADLERSLSDLEPRYEDQDQTLREAFAAMRSADDALDGVGGDDAPARLEEQRRTVRLEIEEEATRYLALRAGILATEQALQHYRERHRSSMMERAGAAFVTITGGAYTGLEAHVTKDVETLVGKVAGGGSKVSTEMSKGTRFQLYLALRVAGYHEFTQRRPAVPFIADDIMETFDDERAEQAFRLFDEMAKVGQVIYLTHHPHLCEIAKKACPGVAIHQIGDEFTGRVAEQRLLSA